MSAETFQYVVISISAAVVSGLLFGALTNKSSWIAALIAGVGYIAAFLTITALPYFATNTISYRYFDSDRWYQHVMLISPYVGPVPALVLSCVAYWFAEAGALLRKLIDERPASPTRTLSESERQAKWARDTPKVAKYLDRPIAAPLYCALYKVPKSQIDEWINDGSIRGYEYGGELYIENVSPTQKR